MKISAQAGRKGPDVRSDCWVKIMLEDSGRLQAQVKSKVKIMYGKSIEALVKKGLAFFNLKHAVVELEDSGALPFTIMARIEAAIRRLKLDNGHSLMK